MSYDPKAVCRTCWEIELNRSSLNDPDWGSAVRRVPPQEPVWIDHDGYLHCSHHIPEQFFELRRVDARDPVGKICAGCGSGPFPAPDDPFPGGFVGGFFDMFQTPSGRIFCTRAHIPLTELKEKSWVRVGPCESCGREIHTLDGQLKDGKPPRLFCSSRCQIRFYDLRKQAKRAEARKRKCVVCGEPFEPLRSNALTCSPACRQKAYRRRAAAPDVA